MFERLKKIITLSALITFLSCASVSDSYKAPPREPAEEMDNPFILNINSYGRKFTMLVLADIHGYNRDELVDDYEAWEKHLQSISRSFDDNFSNTRAVLEKALEADVDFVLIPGDVTVDGEKAGHEMLASILSEFRGKGLKFYTVPGDHDVNIYRGRQFLKGKSGYAPNISADEFAEIYADHGYLEAFSRDPYSLSYAVKPYPGVILFCIDSNMYQFNLGFPFRFNTAFSRIKNRTLRWMKSNLKKASDKGKTIIVMHHHPLYETVFPRWTVIANSKKVREIYREYGVSLVIAGDRHRYYINSKYLPPQIVAPALSGSPEDALLIRIKEEGRAEVIYNPFFPAPEQ